ncbi:type-F conjugative transfer system mating-pair stabilization protein TraN [Kluyvera sichuanensis]|uniref:type-F conjugative transfer system mating-pair stabilization protein TraN n=1 Tax=Kluyvera sichuanensis TaxID=2725494 RepID=UPI0034A1BF8B
MKRHIITGVIPLLFAAMMVALLPGTGAADDAYNAGASFGKGQAGQGTGNLSSPGSVSGAIPGYTANPPQSDYYGGVKGGDGGLADKGLSEMQGNNAAQSIISSGSTNPPPVIDPNAPFITIGKDAESNADGVMAGTGQQCTEATVSKSVFENFQCSANVAVQKTCTRDTKMEGHYEDQASTSVVWINSNTMHVTKINPNTLEFSWPLTAGATMLSGIMTLSGSRLSIIPASSTFTMYGVSTWLGIDKNQTFSLNVAQQVVPADGRIRARITHSYPTTIDGLASGVNQDLWGGNDNLLKFTPTITIVTTKKVWVPSTSTPSVCPESPGGKLTSSVCTIPGGDRQVTVDGVTQTVHSDCWQYTDTYLVSENTAGTCASLIDDAACTKSAETCAEYVDGECSHKDYTYQCQKVYSSSGLVCGGDYICKSGDCDGTNGAGDSGFDEAVAKLAGLASAGQDVANSQNELNVKAFTGEAKSCRKAFAGFANCCKDSGWGQDVGLASCDSDEKALGKAKAKKITVGVGDRCDHKVLGVCVQKSQVYCVFQGKLARIIQEQGRRDQLGVGFGSGENPDCRGITVDELQRIDFDRVNFSDFYEDLMNSVKIPDTDTMVKQVKDRIAAQVQQQQSSGGK